MPGGDECEKQMSTDKANGPGKNNVTEMIKALPTTVIYLVTNLSMKRMNVEIESLASCSTVKLVF